MRTIMLRDTIISYNTMSVEITNAALFLCWLTKASNHHSGSGGYVICTLLSLMLQQRQQHKNDFWQAWMPEIGQQLGPLLSSGLLASFGH